jgi:outer membrane protein assembly factor BamA
MAAIAAGCSNTKKIPPGDALYTGATIKIEDSLLNAKKRNALKKDLATLTRPRPNKKILGIRFKLFAYNLAGNTTKETGIRGWLKHKVGEPPVLLSTVDPEWNIKMLQNSLENRGYFKASVYGDTAVRNKKASATYTARPSVQYMINDVVFEPDSSSLQQTVAASATESFLKSGDPYDLSVIKTERERIDDYLKERGFYYFDPDFLIIEADSTIGEHKVNLFVKVKPNIPGEARNLYKINDVLILPNYRLNASNTDTSKSDADFYNGYYLVDKRKRFKPRLFLQAMQFNPGDVYNQTDHTQTISRLVNLGVFKFVKNRFEPAPGIDTPRLDAYYYLTALPKKSLQGEITTSTKSNNLTGSSFTIGWRNRNAFRGGELLTIDFTGGFEWQVSGQFRGYNTYRAGFETSLAFPRFLVPFVSINTKGGYVPRTRISLAYEILQKQKLYTLNSFRTEFGYTWKENIRKEHLLNPVSITYVQPRDITQLYIDSMAGNPTLAKAVEKQFILGTNYNYIYNDMLRNRIMSGFYFRGGVDLSGNIAGLLSGANVKDGKPVSIAGAQFSQYLKFETDFRYYAKVSSSMLWANRLILGLGVPWGNSLELPYIKQFFVGGNNSVRAFRSRSLGPGSYQAPPSETFLPDQSGDIKIETNTELRMKLGGIVHGAVFVDAGNIWLYNENPLKPGAKFSSDFLKEMAVGTGVGLRFDVVYIVVRLDVAFPLRKPYLPEGERWVIDEIRFGSSDWRRDNIIFNLGIGYPF